MNGAEFKIIYKGSDVAEAEKFFSEGECLAIIYCESGYGVAYIDGERAELKPLCAIALHSRGKSQGITLSEDFSGQFLLTDGSLAKALFSYYTEGKSFHLSEIGERTEKSLRFAEASSEEGDPYLFHALLRAMRKDEPRTAARSGSTSAAAIKEYIDTHTEKKITLEKLSKHFFISKTQIHRLFTASYRVSPMKYMLESKIERSKHLLIATDMKISEIAENLAFTDAKHYTKTFRNLTGMLPGEYRRRKASEAPSDHN